MGLARYDIVPVGKQWGVRHDGKINGEYSTKESAFKSAAMAASMAIHRWDNQCVVVRFQRPAYLPSEAHLPRFLSNCSVISRWCCSTEVKKSVRCWSRTKAPSYPRARCVPETFRFYGTGRNETASDS